MSVVINKSDVEMYYMNKVYHSYKFLYEFYKKHQYDRKVSDDELRERVKYLLKNQVKQRDEISTICWILGEEDERIIE